MSFSIYAAGTRDQVLDALGRHQFEDGDTLGPMVRDLLADALKDAAADGVMPGEMLRYEITASGEAGEDAVTLLTVACGGRYMNESGGPAITDPEA